MLTQSTQLRQQRKVDLEQHVSEVNRLVQQANGVLPGVDYNADSSDDDSADEFQGFDEPEPINHEAEYIDEDKYTTVTVESVNISRSGFSRPGDDADIDAEDLKKVVEMSKEADAAVGKETGGKREIQRDENGKRIWTKERPRTEWPKKKKKKFRYESKADRKATRFKEGAKKRKHATKQKEAREGAS
jgi:ribosomal RNA-processing protein 17